MLLVLAGIGFISVLTATVASEFIKTYTNRDEVIDALKRVEADVAELKTRLPTG